MEKKFPSLSSNPDLAQVFTKFPHGTAPLMALHDVILRNDSPLSIAQRELIAAFVSGTNACRYCFGAHTGISKAYGIDEQIFEGLMDDIDTAAIDHKLKPILHYAKKLTLKPSKITPEDANKVYEAGWDERALYDAILVISMFNFMNRLVEGTGCLPPVTKKKYAPFTYTGWAKGVGFVE